MKELFTGLPYCQYFVNLSCYLKDFWIKIDKRVASLTQEQNKQCLMIQFSPKQLDWMISDAEDASEILFYIQDILNSGDPSLNRFLINSLLHYAFFPCVVRSLCDLRSQPQMTLNTALYVLIQTFRIIKDKNFINLLFSALFMPNVPKLLQDKISQIPEPPHFYSPTFHYQLYQTSNLKDYIMQFFNLNNLEVFLTHGNSQRFEFLQDLKSKYERLIDQSQDEEDLQNQGQDSGDEVMQETFSDSMMIQEDSSKNNNLEEETDFFDCNDDEEELKSYETIIKDASQKLTQSIKEKKQEINREEIKQKIYEEIMSLLSFQDREAIGYEHKRISEALGQNIGLYQKNAQLFADQDIQEIQSITSAYRQIDDAISKDDNLLLLVGGLLVSVINNQAINQKFMLQISEICPRRFRKQRIEGDEEDDTFSYPKFTQVVNRIIEVLEMDPPFRNFTQRIYTKLLVDICPPSSGLLESRYLKRLLQAYKNCLQHLKRMVYQLNPENYLDPYYYFMEIFQKGVQKFVPIQSNHEFNKMLQQPMLMCSCFTEDLQSKLPGQLQIPSSREEEPSNQAFYVQELVLKRWLTYIYGKSGGVEKEFVLPEEPKYAEILNRNYGQVSDWIEGMEVDILPANTKYYVCYFKHSKFNSEQFIYLEDDNFLIMLRPTNQPSKLYKPYQSLLNKLPSQIAQYSSSYNSSSNSMIAPNSNGQTDQQDRPMSNAQIAGKNPYQQEKQQSVGSSINFYQTANLTSTTGITSYSLPIYGMEEIQTYKVVLKRKFKEVIEVQIDNNDPRNMTMYLIDREAPEGYSEKQYQFEKWHDAIHVKEQIIEERKKNQMINEKHIMENFLIEVCEKELFEFLVSIEQSNS
eukprot:403359988